MVKREVTSQPMTSSRRVKLSLLSGFLFVIIIGTMLWFAPLRKSPENQNVAVTPVVSVKPAADVVTYTGKSGIDALSLLKAENTVDQDQSGLVVSINDRKANPSKREYWSFYVNNKMAEVGPSDYQTQDGDQIEWRIESY